jgi:hypothetical protein
MIKKDKDFLPKESTLAQNYPNPFSAKGPLRLAHIKHLRRSEASGSLPAGQAGASGGNPSTVVSYQLPAFSKVKLTIYNVLGQKIKMLVNGFQNAGEHSLVWDATDKSMNPVSLGNYFY